MRDLGLHTSVRGKASTLVLESCATFPSTSPSTLSGWKAERELVRRLSQSLEISLMTTHDMTSLSDVLDCFHFRESG